MAGGDAADAATHDPVAPHDPDAALAALVRRLQALDDTPGPPPAFVQRLWDGLSRQTPSAAVSKGRTTNRVMAFIPFRPTTARRRRPFTELATVAIVLLMLTSGYFAARLAAPRPNPGTADDPSYRVYVPDPQDDGPPMTLDPMTLAGDLSGFSARASATPDTVSYGEWLLSTDGSTLVRIEYGPVTTYVVTDGVGGPERVRFSSEGGGNPWLSDDGRRLIVERLQLEHPADSLAGGYQWDIYDTETGRLLRTVDRQPSGRLDGFGPRWIDASAPRAFFLDLEVSAAPMYQRATQLVTLDLETGAEVGRVTVPVPLGATYLDRPPYADPRTRTVAPNLVGSPDGSQIAIVHPDGAKVTLVDTQGGGVERTLDVSSRPVDSATPPPSAEWLPQSSETVSAVWHGDGHFWQVAFGPSGRDLYIYGTWHSLVRRDRDYDPHALDERLRRVDLVSGEVTVDSADEESVIGLWPSPDGRYLYVRRSVHRPPAYPGPPFLLQRLDASTLAILAERQVSQDVNLVIVPASSQSD